MTYYTIKSLVPYTPHNQLCKTDDGVDWFLSDSNFWTSGTGWDRYFTADEIDNLEEPLRSFVKSEFCEVTEL